MASPPNEQSRRRPDDGTSGRLEQLVRSSSERELRSAAGALQLTEDLAMALLARPDLSASVIQEMAGNQAVMQHRKVLLAVLRHPSTPRRVTMPLVRRLYPFEMEQAALIPSLAPDLRAAIEEALIRRLGALARGERLALARKSSARVAAALLLDADEKVNQAALANPHMTEEAVVKALAVHDAPETLVTNICSHAKWAQRLEVRLALLRNPQTPLAHLPGITQALSTAALHDVLRQAPLDSRFKSCLAAELERRGKSPGKGNEGIYE